MLTTQVVQGNGIVHTDVAVRTWITTHQVHWLWQIADLATAVIQPLADIAALLIYAAWSRRMRFRPALGVVVVLIASVVALKWAVGRPTPLHPSNFFGDYPSGHTAALLVCLGTAILLRDPAPARARLLLAGASAATAGIALSLLYIRAHWLSDVLASLALAVVVLWGVAVTRRASAPRSPS